jgi:hypothetical protein
VNDDARWGAIRALDARKFNVELASEMIMKALEWRRRERFNDVFLAHSLSESYIGKMRSALGDGFYGVDKFGYPIWWCPAGKIHLNALKSEVPLENLLWLHVMMVEFNQRIWYRYLSKKLGRNVYQMTLVLDLTGFGVSNVRGGFYECFNSIGDVDCNIYYENVHRVYIINAPNFFKFFWRTLSPLFEAETRVKFQVLSRPSDLTRFIDERIIPKQFGGKFMDHDVLYGDPKNRDRHTKYTKQFDAYLSAVRANPTLMDDDDVYVQQFL